MNPKTIAALRERPEFRELLGFMASEVAKLDTLDGLDKLDFKERAYEATSRLRAKGVLENILRPLIETGDKPQGIDPREYTVDV